MSAGRDGAELLPRWVTAPLAVGTFALLVWLERRRPLRRAVEPKPARVGRNLALAAIGAVAVQLAETPAVVALARIGSEHGWGLLHAVALPSWLALAVGVVLMDYTLWVWHVLTHRVPLLWRFHLVHHVDLDLDASTALRFHFGELILSIGWRAGQVLALGLSPLGLSVWQTLTLLSIMFHHSNVQLPLGIERRLVRLVVTPRMHGIHHSTVREETDSNWSSVLSVWDRLHRTLRLDVPQTAITIGVPAYREAAELTLPRLVTMPFGRERPAWIGGPSRPPGSPETSRSLA
jgi:sterol desaturase/sphingolipid hydroxylase (fatty acid hydroxylase superfamily)